MSSITTYTPSSSDALYPLFVGRAFDDPVPYQEPDNKRVDGKYFLKPIQDEVLKHQDILRPIMLSVVNGSGGVISKGTLLSVSSSTDDQVVVSKASNSDEDGAAIYVATESATTGATFFASGSAFITSIDTSSYAVGDSLWLSTSGSFVSSEPTSAAIKQLLGVCSAVSSTAGEVFLYPGYSKTKVSGNPFSDSEDLVKGSIDSDKRMRIDVETSVSASTTRVLKMPDANIDLTPGSGDFVDADISAQGKLLGRATAGAGKAEEVSPDGTTIELPAGGDLGVIASGLAMYRKDAEVAVTETAALDSKAFGKIHAVTGTSAQYNITLPDPSGNAGKKIGFHGGSTSALKYAAFVLPNGSEKVGGLYRMMIVPNRFFVLESDGTNWNVVAQNEYKLSGDFTIYMPSPSGDDDTNILNWYYIQPAPRNLGTYTLTFQFVMAAGPTTYKINTGSLKFYGFRNGRLNVYGDTNITTKSTSQKTFLDGDASGITVLDFKGIDLLYVSGFAISVLASSGGYGMQLNAVSQFDVRCCYTFGDDRSGGMGVRTAASNGTFTYNYYNYCYYGIYVDYGCVLLFQNDDITNLPAYGKCYGYAAVMCLYGDGINGNTADSLDLGGILS